MNKAREKELYRWLMSLKTLTGYHLNIVIVLNVLSSLCVFVQMYAVALLIQQAASSVFDIYKDIQLIAIFICFTLLRALCLYLRDCWCYELGINVRTSIRKQIIKRLDSCSIAELESRSKAQWLTALVEQSEHINDFFCRYVPQSTSAIIIPVIFILIVAPISWVVALLFLITAPLIPMFMILVGTKAADESRKNFTQLTRLSGFFLDRLKGLRTIRWFYESNTEFKKLHTISDQYRIKTMELLRIAFLSSTVLEFFSAISIALTAMYIGMSILDYINIGVPNDNFTFFSGIFLLLIAPEFYQPLKELGRFYHARSEAIGAANSIKKFLEIKNTQLKHTQVLFNPSKSISIELKDVTVFADSTESTQLLSNVNFKVNAGERCFIVGKSGAGKTTLLMALLGFSHYKGEILINNLPLEHIALKNYLQHVTWLGQMPHLIYGSLMDNICLGLREAVDKQKIKSILSQAHIFEFVEKLPYGIKTNVGEDGTRLSIGQAQRIALARIFMRDVKLLLLDEPTASLDKHSASCIKDSIARYSCNKTLINATHDLSLLKKDDNVLMLENGRLVEKGKVSELLKQKKYFYKQWNSFHEHKYLSFVG